MDKTDFNNINDEYNNYSKFDGVMTGNLKNKSFTIRKLESEKCPNCNSEIEDKYMYCKDCGFNLEKIYTEDKSINNVKEGKFKRIATYLNIKNNFKISVVSIIILFIASILLKRVVCSYIPEAADIVNPIHILLGLNLGSLNIYSSTMMGLGGLELKLGFIALLVLPLIALAISNLIFNKKVTKSSDSVLRNSLGVGISYGLILGILALISKTKVNYSYEMMQYGYIVQFSYSMLAMIVKGFIIGFILTYILLYKKEYEDENMYLGIFKRALNMLLIGYFATLAILFVLTMVDKSYLYNLGISTNLDKPGMGSILTQLAAYIWSFGNFIPVTIGSKGLSLLNIIKPDLYLTTSLMLIAMFFLSALVIIVSACKLEAKYGKEKGIKPVVLLSIFYAILTGALSILTTVVL
ncbi:MAG: zinc ribbon domain-containing protein, partial [Terrisporobacter sp.]